MLSDYEKNYLETSTSPNSIYITKDMSETEQNLEILRYIKGAIRNQPIYYGRDIEKCDAFLDSLVKENEIALEWERYEKEKV